MMTQREREGWHAMGWAVVSVFALFGVFWGLASWLPAQPMASPWDIYR